MLASLGLQANDDDVGDWPAALLLVVCKRMKRKRESEAMVVVEAISKWLKGGLERGAYANVVPVYIAA